MKYLYLIEWIKMINIINFIIFYGITATLYLSDRFLTTEVKKELSYMKAKFVRRLMNDESDKDLMYLEYDDLEKIYYDRFKEAEMIDHERMTERIVEELLMEDEKIEDDSREQIDEILRLDKELNEVIDRQVNEDRERKEQDGEDKEVEVEDEEEDIDTDSEDDSLTYSSSEEDYSTDYDDEDFDENDYYW